MNKVSKRIALLGVISPALFAVGAMAQPIQLHSTLAGNNPNIVIGGVESAGSPWTVKSGFASLDTSGKLHVKVHDLILPSTGDAGPVTAISASLVCGGSGGTVQSETASVPLSTKGNANLHGDIAVPSLCFAPVVLVHIAATNGTPIPQPGAWIAATGGMNMSSQGMNTPSQGMNTPSQGMNTPSQGMNTPSQGMNTPSQGMNMPSY
jgi:hypothetical protein